MKITQLGKQTIKLLLPPILYQFLQYLRDKLFIRDTPVWSKIEKGPAVNHWLYVPSNRQAFKQMLEGNYDTFYWDFINKNDLKSKTIIDIGGHIGYHSMCFSRLCEDNGKVYVFEPNKYNLERMKLIFKKNNISKDKIIIKDYALSDFKGNTNFNFSKNVNNQTSSGGYIENSYKPLSDEIYKKSNFCSTTINVEKLDNVIEREGITNLSLIKIDVEGAEHKVIQGAKNTISRYKPMLLIEIHSSSTMFYVCRDLYNLNYDIKILKEDKLNMCYIAATQNKNN